MSSQRQRRLDIIPDGFVDAYGADTIEEALEAAERARSVTECDQMEPRCSECFSVKVVEKISHRDIPNRRPEPWKCLECTSHLWETMPSIAEIREETREELTEAAGRAGRLAQYLEGDR